MSADYKTIEQNIQNISQAFKHKDTQKVDEDIVLLSLVKEKKLQVSESEVYKTSKEIARYNDNSIHYKKT